MNARQLWVTKVTIDGHVASFTHDDHQRDIPLQHTHTPSVQDHADFKRLWEAMAQEAKEGELQIHVPDELEPTPVRLSLFILS